MINHARDQAQIQMRCCVDSLKEVCCCVNAVSQEYSSKECTKCNQNKTSSFMENSLSNISLLPLSTSRPSTPYPLPRQPPYNNHFTNQTPLIPEDNEKVTTPSEHVQGEAPTPPPLEKDAHNLGAATREFNRDGFDLGQFAKLAQRVLNVKDEESVWELAGLSLNLVRQFQNLESFSNFTDFDTLQFGKFRLDEGGKLIVTMDEKLARRKVIETPLILEGENLNLVGEFCVDDGGNLIGNKVIEAPLILENSKSKEEEEKEEAEKERAALKEVQIFQMEEEVFPVEEERHTEEREEEQPVEHEEFESIDNYGGTYDVSINYYERLKVEFEKCDTRETKDAIFLNLGEKFGEGTGHVHDKRDEDYFMVNCGQKSSNALNNCALLPDNIQPTHGETLFMQRGDKSGQKPSLKKQAHLTEIEEKVEGGELLNNGDTLYNSNKSENRLVSDKENKRETRSDGPFSLKNEIQTKEARLAREECELNNESGTNLVPSACDRWKRETLSNDFMDIISHKSSFALNKIGHLADLSNKDDEVDLQSHKGEGNSRVLGQKHMHMSQGNFKEDARLGFGQEKCELGKEKSHNSLHPAGQHEEMKLISQDKNEKEDGGKKLHIGSFGWNRGKNIMPISSIKPRRMTRIDEQAEQTQEASTHENIVDMNPINKNPDSIIDGFHTSSRRTLHFVAPESQNGIPIIKPKKETVVAGAKKWNTTALGYLLGKKPYFYHLQSFAKATWKGIKDIIAADNGFYLFIFDTENSMEDVIQGGPWLFNGQPIFLQKWQPGLSLERKKHRHVPVWVKLRNLPLEYWTTEGLSVVASGVGQPLYPDTVTKMCSRIDYARVCVLIDMEGSLPKEVVIVKPTIEGGVGGPCKVGVEYEWLPKKCSSCQEFGHDSIKCPKKDIDKKPSMLQIYLPKKAGLMQTHHHQVEKRNTNKFKPQKSKQQWVPRAATRPCPRPCITRPKFEEKRNNHEDHPRGTRPPTRPCSQPCSSRVCSANFPSPTRPGTRPCSRPCSPRSSKPIGSGDIVLSNSFARLEDLEENTNQITSDDKPQGPKQCSPLIYAP